MFDYLIHNARILDGSGAPARQGDVALSGGQIAAVGHLTDAEAAQVLDARGRYLTPGFLDIHRHADDALFRPGWGKAELAQGLTTVVNGNCGLSLAPVEGPYRPPLHTGMLVGMGTLRACVAGFRDGPLTEAEYRQLHALLERALGDGALGVSLGLGYAPECFYDTTGLIRALEPLRDSGVPITVHMRQEGDGVVEALSEMLTVARSLRTPVEISHLKAIGRRNWRRAVPQMLEMLSQARQEGLDIACDVYPYPAGSTQLIHVLPPEFQAGGMEALTAALQDTQQRAAMRRRMETGTDFENISLLVGFENILPTSLHDPADQSWEGISLADMADRQGRDPFDVLFDLLAREHCAASMIDRITDQADIDDILRAPFSSVISDATYPAGGLLHPRVYGTFPRVLESYVRERHVLTLPEAVHKMTRLPADRLGLARKGRIEVGADADLCLFDPAAIHERGTWQAPEQLAAGMDYVFVAGVPAIAEGRFTGSRNGEVL